VLNLERDISFRSSWTSYRNTRLKEKENHQFKQNHDGVPIRSLKHCLDILSHVLDQSFRAFEDSECLSNRIYAKYSRRIGILSYFDIESEVKQDIAKSALVLCLKNLEKHARSADIPLSLLKLFLLISLPIIFIITRNFSIQKNLSISA
jgi:Txe/YoeB family toxin of Txe-Axe toxin-antitoxin module